MQTLVRNVEYLDYASLTEVLPSIRIRVDDTRYAAATSRQLVHVPPHTS